MADRSTPTATAPVSANGSNQKTTAKAAARKTAKTKEPPAKTMTGKTVKTRVAAVEKPRRAKLGDVTGSQQPQRIARLSTAAVTEARQQAKFAAVRDILGKPGTSKKAKAESLRAILEGAAPDDARAIRRLLRQETDVARSKARAVVNPDELLAADWRSGAYPYKNLLSRKVYESQKYLLQVELLKLQAWAKETGQRVVILFEGRDAAGKGGTIKRMMEHLNPRGARVVALEKPSEVERGQWYFQRYIEELPNSGQIKFFDRSWYNRAVVEPVMGFCTDKQYETFMKQVPNFEHMLYEDGIMVIKFWFDISREEQQKRFDARLGNPLKEWKFSPVDLKGQELWDKFTEYKDLMFTETHTSYCPWVVVETNDKEEARLESLRYVLSRFKYPGKGKTKANLKNDPNVIFKYFRKNKKFDL